MRLIPVHTGNTSFSQDARRAETAHPRAYGEYNAYVEQVKQAVGSSPCIRGIPYSSSGLLGRVRLIPVHTGNTPRPAFRAGRPAAHPRAYGEYRASAHLALSAFGSSPCIRGIQGVDLVALRASRLIPVHTGNTFSSSLRMRKATAHPRAYGEYRTASIRHKLPCGSSPCIRGIPTW